MLLVLLIHLDGFLRLEPVGPRVLLPSASTAINNHLRPFRQMLLPRAGSQ